MATPQPIRFQDIYIAQPCSERWQDMDAASGGAYCRNCKKVVIDYTQMSEAELNAHFAAGEATGCGKFRKSQIGRAPISASPSATQMWLDRWRSGAAAALLFLSLWQLPKVGKAEPKRISCLLPGGSRPQEGNGREVSSSFISVVLVDENWSNIEVDFPITLILPNGDSILIMTSRGLFSMDLTGRASATDTLTISVATQQIENAYFSAFSFRADLSSMGNLTLEIPVQVGHDPQFDICVGTLKSRPNLSNLNYSIDVIKQNDGDETPEPLFRTKTPEEKALAKANRDAKRAERDANTP